VAERTAGSVSQSVSAWDLPTRLFHWTLVALMACSWISFEFAEDIGDYLLKWHRWNGYAILVLVVWRLLWGVVGSPTSRFANFVRSPLAALQYGLDLLRGRDRHFLGHNPLGTWMVLVLLALVAGDGMLGLFTVEHNDIVAGPLYTLVSEATVKAASHWHWWIFYNVVLAVVAAHVTANVLYGLIKREPLIKAMITGSKPAAIYEDAASAGVLDRPLMRAAICLVMATVIVFGGIVAAGGRL